MVLLKLRGTQAYPRYGGGDIRYRSSIDRG
jgi:hypothetical protein